MPSKNKEKNTNETNEEVKEEVNEVCEETKEEVKEEIKEEKKEPSEIEKLQNEIKELKDSQLRTMADYENYKRRTRQEKESTYEYAVCETVKNIIPVLDTLELSLKNQQGDVESFRQGIELIVKNFHDTLAKIGVTAIEAEGKAFDPELHNAVMSADEGEGESGTIIEEFQKGYKLKERIIRHSMVKVKS